MERYRDNIIMQSPDDSVCRGLADNSEDTATDDTTSTCSSSNKAPPPPRLLACSVSSSSSLSSNAAAAQQQQYANVAEIMSASKKYDSNQVCF